MLIYLRESTSGGERPGERQRENKKQTLLGGEPKAELDPRTPGSSPEPEADAQPTELHRCP